MEKGSSGEGGEEDGDALEQLRYVFDLCDSDEDGIISVDDFRRMGRDHFDKSKVTIDTRNLAHSRVCSRCRAVAEC